MRFFESVLQVSVAENQMPVRDAAKKNRQLLDNRKRSVN